MFASSFVIHTLPARKILGRCTNKDLLVPLGRISLYMCVRVCVCVGGGGGCSVAGRSAGRGRGAVTGGRGDLQKKKCAWK